MVYNCDWNTYKVGMGFWPFFMRKERILLQLYYVVTVKPTKKLQPSLNPHSTSPPPNQKLRKRTFSSHFSNSNKWMKISLFWHDSYMLYLLFLTLIQAQQEALVKIYQCRQPASCFTRGHFINTLEDWI